MNLAGVIDELTHTAKGMRLPDLRRLVTDLKPDRAEFEAYVQFTENHYARNLIHKNPDFEVLVLCWRAGQRSPIHDHGDSICAVQVVAGVLSADNYRRSAGGHLRADYSEDLNPGSVLSIQTTEIHQVSNLQADGTDLITLHIYSPPLLRMKTYSLTDRAVGEYVPEIFEHGFGSGI